MTNFLDQVIANTPANGGPSILSVNHDTNSINWVNGLSDPGEMLGCGRYQQLRRLAGESDPVYQARLVALLPTLLLADRVKIESAMKAAALQRFGVDTSTGKVALMVAGKAAWSGLGINIAAATDSANAMKLSSTDWTVGKEEVFYVDATGTKRKVPGVFAVVRTDTGTVLGSVGSMTKVIQNVEGFKFLDNVMAQYGAKYVSAGALHGGKKVWMQVELPNQSFSVNGSDRTDTYAIFTNPHDGSGSAYCYPVSNRVECANTFRIAQRSKGKGIAIPHFGDVSAKIAAAQAALGLAVTGFDEYKAAAQAMTVSPLADPVPYFEGLLDTVLAYTVADLKAETDLLGSIVGKAQADHEAKQKALARKEKERSTLLEDLIERYESETNGKNGMRGKVWAAFNAATESADHGKLGGRQIGSDKVRAERRFESAVAGRADDVKQVAYRQAVALAN
jgi:phage/plasmid-like protein (TIGR03299 family)